MQCFLYYYTESIRNAIEEADYDQDIAIEALSSSGDCSNSSSFSNIQDDEDMNVDVITKQKQINDEINKIINVTVKVVIEVITFIIISFSSKKRKNKGYEINVFFIINIKIYSFIFFKKISRRNILPAV